MKPRLNFSFLMLTLLVVVLVVGGVAGFSWWRAQPDNLYSSALDYYEKGKALAASDPAAAKKNFESADKQLLNLLDKDKAPKHAPGMLLRHHVLEQLSLIAAKEEKDRGDTAPDRQSVQFAREARRLAFLAATDPNYFEAQTVAMNYCFLSEDYRSAAGFAENVIRHQGDVKSDFSNLNDYLLGARYVLARSALEFTNPPRPDVALLHLEESAKLQKSQEGVPPAPPRWRAFGLEVEALRKKIDLARQNKPKSGSRPGSQPATSDGDDVAALHARIDEGLARVQKEMDQVLQASPSEPSRPIFATLSATNSRGLFGFLDRAILESANADEARERITLALEVARKVVKNQPSEQALRVAADFVARLPAFIPHLPPDIRPSTASLAGLNQTVEELGNEALKAGVPIEPVTYLQMAENASKENNAKEALRLANEGLKVAAQRGLAASDQTLLKLHHKAAWMLLLTGEPEEAEKHLAALRKDKEGASSVHLIQGLLAVQDGRLVQGVRELEKVRDIQGLANQVYLQAALAHAYLGQGRYELALETLSKVEKLFKDPKKLTVEQLALADRYLSPRGVPLYRIACYLGLGRLDKAQEIRQQLKDEG